MTDSRLINIGKISKNQGNKGEVRVIPWTDYPERFTLLDKVFLSREESPDNLVAKKVEGVRFHKNFVILKLEGLENINDALEFKNYLVKIPAEDSLPLAEDEYYIDDILGFEVLTQEEVLGKLDEVITTGGTDIFLVKGQQKEYLIPAAREIVVEIDLEAQKIYINPIPGLLEL